MWTESFWNTIGLRVYAVQATSYDWLVLLIGIIITVASYFAVIVGRSYISKIIKRDWNIIHSLHYFWDLGPSDPTTKAISVRCSGNFESWNRTNSLTHELSRQILDAMWHMAIGRGFVKLQKPCGAFQLEGDVILLHDTWHRPTGCCDLYWCSWICLADWLCIGRYR